MRKPVFEQAKKNTTDILRWNTRHHGQKSQATENITPPLPPESESMDYRQNSHETWPQSIFLSLKTFELVRAYWRLWFPPVPESGCDHDLSFVVSFVKKHAQGNVSLQAGKFLTRSRHDKMINELECYRFSA